MIEREVVQGIADVDYTDDCRVKVWLRKRRSTLTVTEAKQLRAELDAAIGEAERGLADLLRTTTPCGFDLAEAKHVHPECVAGKCDNCDGTTLTVTDEWVPCDHHCHDEEVAA